MYSDWTGVPWINLPSLGDLQLQGHIVWSVWRLQWQSQRWHARARRHRDQWRQCVWTQLGDRPMGDRPQVSNFNMAPTWSWTCINVFIDEDAKSNHHFLAFISIAVRSPMTQTQGVRMRRTRFCMRALHIVASCWTRMDPLLTVIQRLTTMWVLIHTHIRWKHIHTCICTQTLCKRFC